MNISEENFNFLSGVVIERLAQSQCIIKINLTVLLYYMPLGALLQHTVCDEYQIEICLRYYIFMLIFCLKKICAVSFFESCIEFVLAFAPDIYTVVFVNFVDLVEPPPQKTLCLFSPAIRGRTSTEFCQVFVLDQIKL